MLGRIPSRTTAAVVRVITDLTPDAIKGRDSLVLSTADDAADQWRVLWQVGQVQHVAGIALRDRNKDIRCGHVMARPSRQVVIDHRRYRHSQQRDIGSAGSQDVELSLHTALLVTANHFAPRHMENGTRLNVDEVIETINLETLAWLAGKLRIRLGGLSGAEGRIVATASHGGVIRVASDSNLGRFRFTIAHELGHFVLHQNSNINRTFETKHFTVWNKATEEAEANYFAAELLMPEFLFKSRCKGKPSIALLDALAEEFRTSLIATAFQFWEYSNEPIALVLSNGWDMKSYRPFKDGWPKIQYGRIHEDSAAGERLAGKSEDSGRMVRTPAYAWLEDFEDSHDKDIMEDSRCLDYYDRTVTLLWIDEDLN